MRLKAGEGATVALTPLGLRVGPVMLSIAPDDAGVWALRVDAAEAVDVELLAGSLDLASSVGDLHHVVSDRLRRASLLRDGSERSPVTGHTSVGDVAQAAVSLGVDLAWALGRTEISGIPRPPSVELSTIAARVLATRRARGMSVHALAKAAEITTSTVERVERGEWMALATLERLAAALSVHPHSLALPL